MIVHADMLEHADRCDLVVLAVERVVVAQLELDLVLQAEPLNLRLGEIELLLRQRHAVRLHAVVLRSVADQRAPAAANVEEALALREPQLAADHLQLVALRLREVIAPLDEVSAGVNHLRIEEERVERIGEVVVVLDVVLVAADRLALAEIFERPGAAPRQEGKLSRHLEGLPLVEPLAEFAGALPRPGRERVDHRAVDEIDTAGDPEVERRVDFWLADQGGNHAFIGEPHRNGIGRIVGRHPRAVPQHEADIDPVGFTHMREEGAKDVEAVSGGHSALYSAIRRGDSWPLATFAAAMLMEP